MRDADVDDAVRGVVAGRIRPVNVNARTVAVSLVEEVRGLHGAIGDVLVDREYTQQNDGQDFLLPIRRMGAEPVFDLKSNQIGPRGMVNGAIIIEGRPYSPSLPEVLRTIPPQICRHQHLHISISGSVPNLSIHNGHSGQ